MAAARGKKGGEPGSPRKESSPQHSIYIQNETDKHRATIAGRSWQHGKGEEQVESWDIIKKCIPPPKKTEVPGGNWSTLTQEESEDQKHFGKPRTVREGGKRWGLFGNWGEGTALPLLGFHQPLQSGRKRKAYNPPKVGLGLPDALGRRPEGSHKGVPSREMMALPPFPSATLPGYSGP